MGNPITHGGITTKIRAMSSRLLAEDDYRHISEFRNVAELVVWLKQSDGYREAFAEIDDVEIRREDVSRRLAASYVRDFEKIYLFSARDQRQYLDLYFKQFEIRLLKRSLRLALDGKPHRPEPELYTDFFRKHTKLDIEKLAAAWTGAEFTAALAGTEYYRPLSHLDAGTAVLFDYEMALDMYYFGMLWNELDNVLKGDDLEELKLAHGTQFDLINLNWIARSKRFYRLKTEDVIARLIPVLYRLKKQQVKALAEAADDAAFEAALKDTWYAGKYVNLTAQNLDSMYDDIMTDMLEREARRRPYTNITALAYLFRKKRETERLTTAFECLVYGMKPEDTIKHLLKQ